MSRPSYGGGSGERELLGTGIDSGGVSTTSGSRPGGCVFDVGSSSANGSGELSRGMALRPEGREFDVGGSSNPKSGCGCAGAMFEPNPPGCGSGVDKGFGSLGTGTVSSSSSNGRFSIGRSAGEASDTGSSNGPGAGVPGSEKNGPSSLSNAAGVAPPTGVVGVLFSDGGSSSNGAAKAASGAGCSEFSGVP